MLFSLFLRWFLANPRQVPSSLQRLSHLSLGCSFLGKKVGSCGAPPFVQQECMTKYDLNIRHMFPAPQRKELSLSKNQLRLVPEAFNLPELKHLDLSFNQLTMLPGSAWLGMFHLATGTRQKRPTLRLPNSIVLATSLTELLVNHNRRRVPSGLQVVHGWDFLIELITLMLRNCWKLLQDAVRTSDHVNISATSLRSVSQVQPHGLPSQSEMGFEWF